MMRKYLLGFALAATAAVVSGVANAATIAAFGTGSSGAVSGGVLSYNSAVGDVNNGSYFQNLVSSSWVWPADTSGFGSLTATFTFDLTGYDLNTVNLSGLWGIDNTGTVSLNGNLLDELPTVTTGNFSSLHSYGTSIAGFFNAGANTLTFSLNNAGGPGGFRAEGEVTASSISAVPLPAALPLLLASLGGFSVMARRKK